MQVRSNRLDPFANSNHPIPLRRPIAMIWPDFAWHLHCVRPEHNRAAARRAGGGSRESGSFEEIDPQPGVPRQHVEIAVVMKHRRAGADGNRADEAVDQLANGLSLATAGAIQGGRLVVARVNAFQTSHAAT